jgi:ABC-type antimicrobial peptide transport system permease subunit
MALGATQGSVVKMVLREVLTLTGFSVAVALPLSIALSTFVKSQLFGISDRDPATLLLVTLAIGTVALLAAWAPAHRATQVQPITALRYE